jgi:colanic acid biosynthesis glycosyl transferase WcaI
MRILLINQFFAPDPAPTGQLLADVARALIADGHSVEVLCSRSSYEAYDEVGHHGLERVKVRRIGGFPFGRGRISRLSSYGCFFISALVHIAFRERSEVILTLTTPPLLSLAGTLGKHLRGSRHLIWEMDVYPDIAVGVGVFGPGGLLDRAVGGLADFSRRHADGIITLGLCMRDRLVARGIPVSKIDIAGNWADGSRISPRPFPSGVPLVLLYSGNLGRAHDVDTIAETVNLLAYPERFRFIFAGGGARRARLQASCGARSNTEFLPYQAHSSLADHLGRCHIGLVTQNSATCGSVVPSKTYTLMAAGRPFIFVGPLGATPARLIERFNCGWHIEPGDSSSLIALLETLHASPELIHGAGERARNAFLSHCDLPAGTARIVSILTGDAPVAEAARSAEAVVQNPNIELV